MQGIEKEYAELDTVWFMAGSLFKSYPYDIPTEAFSLDIFTQVRCASITPRALSSSAPACVHAHYSPNGTWFTTLAAARALQAFAAVQASVVHLQGVSLAKRFALVPLGPPLLSYASTAKARSTRNPKIVNRNPNITWAPLLLHICHPVDSRQPSWTFLMCSESVLNRIVPETLTLACFLRDL